MFIFMTRCHDMWWVSWYVIICQCSTCQSSTKHSAPLDSNCILIALIAHAGVSSNIPNFTFNNLTFCGKKELLCSLYFCHSRFPDPEHTTRCISWRKWLWRDKSTARIFRRTLLKTTFTCNLVKKSTKLQECFREVECEKVQMDVFSLFQAKTMRLAVSF